MAKQYRIFWKPGQQRTTAMVERVKRIGRNTIQTSWPEFPSGDLLKEMIGVHDVETGEPIAEWNEPRTSMNVSNAWIASLDESRAAALNLPPSTKLGLDLRSYGLPSESNFRVLRRFKTAAGIEVSRDVVGAFLQNEDRIERLPNPLFDVESASAPLRTLREDQAERLKCLERLTHTLEKAGVDVFADGFLDNLRVFYAGGISLSLKIDDDQFDFDPVLFNRPNDLDASDELLDENEDSLLSEVLQQEFLNDFRRRGRKMHASSLGNGAFVYLDPFVAKALHLIAEKKAAPKDERKAFALAPRRAFKDAFALNAADEEAIDCLFIETDQFSSRVSSIDLWRPPILPWIKPRPNTWLPEEFGFKIGEQIVRLSPEKATELAKKIEAAIKAGEAQVDFDGIVVEATSRSLEAATELADLGASIQEGEDTPEKQPPAEDISKRYKRFLIVNENFETVTYEPETLAEEIWEFDIHPPTSLRSPFKKHQQIGFKWLAVSRYSDNKGALLADDMGVGKTLQALAFIQWRKELSKGKKFSVKPTLIVAPTSLQDNWLNEMATHFLPTAFTKTQKVTGTYLRSIRGSKSEGNTDIGVLDVGRLREYDVLITTYETMRDYHLSFARLAFDVVIFDEVQKLKNPASQVTHTAKTLNAEYVLSMTGTPVENRLHDVWSIMDVTWPGQLGSSKEFVQNYTESSIEDLRKLNDKLTKPLSKSRPPIMLRRMKHEILDGLPEKSVRKRPRSMPREQATAYTDAIRRARSSSGSGAMLRALHEWRSISVHPNPAPAYNPALISEIVGKSARFLETFEILREIKGREEKALIFLENLDWQAWLANALRTEFSLADNPLIINGSVPGPKRQALVDRFQNSSRKFDVMILSPRAAGVGLTITAANNVIHLSRWWNPAVEDQATDRVYRIGQLKPVTVYIPQAIHPSGAISESSFDLKLDELMERKRHLSGSLLAPADANNSELEKLFEDVVSADFDETEKTDFIIDDNEEYLRSAQVGTERQASRKIGAVADHIATDGPHDPLPIGKYIPVEAVAAGDPRPIETVVSAIDCGELVEVWIEDPYFPCTNVLEPSVSFLKENIFSRFGMPKKLRLRALDPNHPKIRSRMRNFGKRAIQARICDCIGMPVQFKFEGRQVQHFHDRSIIFVIATPFGMKNVRWNLPGGLDHWVDIKRPQQATIMISEGSARWT